MSLLGLFEQVFLYKEGYLPKIYDHTAKKANNCPLKHREGGQGAVGAVGLFVTVVTQTVG